MNTKKKPYRIAIFHCGFVYSGGGERLIIEEAKGLIKRGYDVTIYVPTIERKLCYPDQLSQLQVKTFLPHLPSFIPAKHAIEMVLSSLLAPLYAIRFRSYDAILGANQPGAWIAYCVAKVLGKPYTVYMNQPNRLLYPRKIDKQVNWQNLKEYYSIDKVIKKMRFFVDWADKNSFTKGHDVLVNGGYIGKIIQDIYHKPTTLCPAGATLQPKNSLQLTPDEAYKGTLSISNIHGDTFVIKKPYILITNRHQPQKRFDYGLKALQHVVKKYPKMRLVIPGPFTDESYKLQKLAKTLGLSENVIFTHQISEEALQKLYRGAIVYWYTAPEEDFGMGVIESMGWGVPVIAWNHAGPTVTIKDTATGFLAKPYDTSDFAQKTLLAIHDPKKRIILGRQAWERVEKYFTWQKHVDVVEKSLLAAIADKHR